MTTKMFKLDRIVNSARFLEADSVPAPPRSRHPSVSNPVSRRVSIVIPEDQPTLLEAPQDIIAPPPIPESEITEGMTSSISVGNFVPIASGSVNPSRRTSVVRKLSTTNSSLLSVDTTMTHETNAFYTAPRTAPVQRSSDASGLDSEMFVSESSLNSGLITEQMSWLNLYYDASPDGAKILDETPPPPPPLISPSVSVSFHLPDSEETEISVMEPSSEINMSKSQFICPVCQQPVTGGSYYSAFNSTIHDRCFNCAVHQFVLITHCTV
jgi:hypothetical protein